MRHRVINGCTLARNTSGIFQCVRQSMRHQAEAYMAKKGQHFEHLLEA
jgi:hypothetical protein